MEPQGVLRDLLAGVERLLTQRERQAEAALVSRIAEVLSHAPDPRTGLDELYAVHGMQEVALRLLWALQEVERAGSEQYLEQERFDDHVERVAREVERLAAAAERLRREQPGYLDLGDALQRVGTVLGEMNRAASETPFKGLDAALFSRAGDEAETLREAAGSEGKRELVAFAQGLQRFCNFVLDRRLMYDLRCARLIGNAHFALQAAQETSNADVFDALRQTTHLLNNPDTVFV